MTVVAVVGLAVVSPGHTTSTDAGAGLPVRRRDRGRRRRLLADQPSTLAWFARQQESLREHHPSTLIVWGPQDGYMPEAAGRAYLRDLPDAEVHVPPDAGHRLLETHLGEAVALVRDFLTRVHPAPA